MLIRYICPTCGVGYEELVIGASPGPPCPHCGSWRLWLRHQHSDPPSAPAVGSPVAALIHNEPDR